MSELSVTNINNNGSDTSAKLACLATASGALHPTHVFAVAVLKAPIPLLVEHCDEIGLGNGDGPLGSVSIRVGRSQTSCEGSTMRVLVSVVAGEVF